MKERSRYCCYDCCARVLPLLLPLTRRLPRYHAFAPVGSGAGTGFAPSVPHRPSTDGNMAKVDLDPANWSSRQLVAFLDMAKVPGGWKQRCVAPGRKAKMVALAGKVRAGRATLRQSLAEGMADIDVSGVTKSFSTVRVRAAPVDKAPAAVAVARVRAAPRRVADLDGAADDAEPSAAGLALTPEMLARCGL